jgi:hypothetical protein
VRGNLRAHRAGAQHGNGSNHRSSVSDRQRIREDPLIGVAGDEPRYLVVTQSLLVTPTWTCGTISLFASGPPRPREIVFPEIFALLATAALVRLSARADLHLPMTNSG